MNQKEKNTVEVQIEIIPILKAILSKWWLILLIGVICGATVFGLTKAFVKPTYRSGFSAYINNQQGQNGKDSLTSGDLNAAQQLTRTYSYMIKSSSVLTAATQSLGVDIPYSKLKHMVDTEIQTDTEIIYVYVVDEDPQFAYDLATEISKIAPVYMAEFVEGSSMKIIDQPVLSTKRFKPSYLSFAVLGFFAGALLVAVVIIIQYFKDDTIKDEVELEERFMYPVLGIIPDTDTAGSGNKYYYYYGHDDEKSSKKQEG